MPVSRTQLVVAVVLTALLGAVVYVGSTVGVERWLGSTGEATSGAGAVPEMLYNAPDSVPTTAAYGPVGAVSVVFAGTDVLTGLSGTLANPWIAVSSHTGEYRALDVPHPPRRDAGPESVPESVPESAPVSVSVDGRTLAWASDDGVVVYDAVHDRSRVLTDGIGTDPVVGALAPDASRLLVHDGALRVVDVATGDIAGTADGVPVRAAQQAVWTPDGDTISYVAGGRFVSLDPENLRRTGVATTIPAGATLAWQPSGAQLAAMREVRGVRVVDVFEVAAAGTLELARTVRPPKFSMQQLLGFTSDSRISVVALNLESGAIARVYRVSTVDTSPPQPVMQLPGPGTNWVGVETMAVPQQPLANGSVAYGEPRWPWSHGAKLVASAVLALFLLGLYLTRRMPKRMRRG